MKFLPPEDTIVALSSPLGSGAIAIIRVSGKKCLSLVNPLLKNKVKETDSRYAKFNELYHRQGKGIIDQVITTYFKAPGSYTGDDLIEISCHCNTLIINKVLEEIVEAGARIAEPGEFTYRAFMNGKMNLTQAEAVAEIINARSRQSLTQSVRHLEGKLSERVNEIRKDILNYLSLLEINLDFSEEEIEALPYPELSKTVSTTIDRIHQLLSTYDYGRLLQEGINLLILGKPNVGKSSLLNVLVEKERAIVSEIPGTTRDYIEASLELDGLAVKAVDTAGVRQTEDTVEAIGVQRTLEQLKTTDIALCLFESHHRLAEDDRALMKIIRDNMNEVKFVLILNKTDLGHDSETERALQSLDLPLVKISATNNSGIAQLKETIKKQFIHDQSMEAEEVVVTSIRHKRALEKTIDALTNAKQSIELNASEEIIAVDIRLALDHLGDITGETTSEDVLNHIFSSFCIGK